MRRARLVQFLRAKSPLVTLLTVVPLVVAVLGLTACVKHPVGDPEKSKVDPQVSGVWGNGDSAEANLWIIRPYDSRTHCGSPAYSQHLTAWPVAVGRGGDMRTCGAEPRVSHSLNTSPGGLPAPVGQS